MKTWTVSHSGSGHRKIGYTPWRTLAFKICKALTGKRKFSSGAIFEIFWRSEVFFPSIMQNSKERLHQTSNSWYSKFTEYIYRFLFLINIDLLLKGLMTKYFNKSEPWHIKSFKIKSYLFLGSQVMWYKLYYYLFLRKQIFSKIKIKTRTKHTHTNNTYVQFYFKFHLKSFTAY